MEFPRLVVDALPAHVVLLDAEGTIVAANAAWRRFATANDLRLPQAAIGANYLETCERASGPSSSGASEMAAGIRAVLAGQLETFTLEYPCHSPNESRWFRATVTPLPTAATRHAVVSHVEISAEKQVAEENRRLAARLVTTLESLTDGLVAVNREWQMTYANGQAERLLRQPRGAMLGHVIWDLFPAAIGGPFEDAARRAVSRGEPEVFENYYAPLEGWFEVRIYPSAEGIAVYFRDVTQTHNARQALQASEERFRLLAKATNDAIWDWDLSTDALWWSEGFETLFGFNRSELAPSIVSWTGLIHPDDRDTVVRSVHHAIENRAASWTEDYRFRRADGTYAHVLDRGEVIVNGEGRPIRMIGGMTDLSERKRAEQQLREQAALLDIAHDAIIVRDLEDRIRYWNRSAERLYGWTAPEVQGRPASEFLVGDSAVAAAADASLAEHGEWSGEMEHVTRSGQTVIVEARWTLVKDERGEPRSILAINTDITERKRLELQILRAQRMESIGTLAGGIAHDLNNVLAPILMSVGMLQLDEPDPSRKETLETIEKSARRGADMVSQVLSFARGVEGRRLEVQLHHLVRDMVQIVTETFPKNIEIATDVAPDLWTLQADPTQLHQVLLNLCVNARDAMPDGGQLTIRASNMRVDEHFAAMSLGTRPGPYVKIEVEDTGVGIPPAIIDRIFDPFFTTKEPGKGTGLGLSTTLGIIESHRGFIRVYSRPGAGTIFRAYLPAEGQATQANVSAARRRLPRGRGELILVVDDEPLIRQVTRQMLETFGYRVLLAENGAEAVSLYAERQSEVAAVLTDMVMPVMDGPATIAVLRRLSADLPIVAASGMAGEGLVAQVMEAGVKQFLAKPYSAETLLGAIRQAIDGTRGR